MTEREPEADDRRHAVIWTPEKLPPGFYEGLQEELRNGGVAAFHHYLLHVDLGDFGVATLPPMTDAKRELIDLSKDSPSRFVQAFEAGDIDGFPGLNAPSLLLPALSTDLFGNPTPDLFVVWKEVVKTAETGAPIYLSSRSGRESETGKAESQASHSGS